MRTAANLAGRAAFALLLVTACGAPIVPVLEAQEPTRSEAELVRAMDSLVPALREAQDAAEAAVARRRAAAAERQAPLDTLTVGAATVVVPRGRGAAARSVMEPVWEEEYAGWAGNASPAGTWISFQWSSDPVEIRIPDRNRIRVEGSRWHTRSYMRDGARAALGGRFTGQLRETRLGHWLDGALLRAPENGGAVYRRMATAASHPARACMAGDLDACATALSLEMDDSPFDEWYSPEERRLAVRRRADLWAGEPERRTLLDSCLGGDDRACDTLLTDYRAHQLGGPGTAGTHPYWGAPLPGWVRATFLWSALGQGDPDTWTRLVEVADSEVGPALEGATGKTTRELVAVWHAWVLDQRPRKENTAGAATLPALLWAALFFTLAMRSTRWRLG